MLFRSAGIPLAEGNASFDASLKDRNPDWGLRGVEDVAAVALGAELVLEAVHDMPANNVSLVFRRG